MTVYTLRAAGETLSAESLAELAEIVACAVDADDRIERFRAVDHGEPRLLTPAEFQEMLRLTYLASHGVRVRCLDPDANT